MTYLALMLAGYINGVARRHAETAARMYPGYQVKAITNGVHVPTWTHASFARLYETMAPSWGHEPELLIRADQLPDDLVWQARQEAKSNLLAKIGEITGVTLDPSRPVIGFARRMTAYKRPELLFSDLDRLTGIATRHPFHLVVAGKAHRGDQGGKVLIQHLHGQMQSLSNIAPAVFLPNYDAALARVLVAGSDIWLNTPLPPLEASGTSGMKAALNGGLNLSVLDGWWIEACLEGVTGWAIGADGDCGQTHAAALYDKLEQAVLPLYYQDRPRWIWMVKQAISKIGSHFNSQRMMRRYASEAYLR